MDAPAGARNARGLLVGAVSRGVPQPLQRAAHRTFLRRGGRSGRERGPAAAGMGRVRVHELEAAPVQAADVVDLQAAEVLRTVRIDPHFHVPVLDELVAFFGLLVAVQLVAESRTTATHDGDPELGDVQAALAGTDLPHSY